MPPKIATHVIADLNFALTIDVLHGKAAIAG